MTVSSVGPANASNVIAGIQVNPAAAGTVPGNPAQQNTVPPTVTCTPATPASAGIMATGTQMFIFTCTAVSGNGFVFSPAAPAVTMSTQRRMSWPPRRQ